ncbi:MAG: polysaccharide export protein [Gemmatimonadaceae bacterium]|nr:polysaccharide export protein [Gemmatimonadaceae bacterium]MDQ3244152.1 polysaccharide export protein [Gemmatimonadota bacterium]
MLRIVRLLTATLALFVTADLGAQVTAAANPQVQGLNPGDQIRIAVWRSPEFTGDFTVAFDGSVIHPLFREVQVTGISMAEVESRLRTFLTRYIQNPQFVIQPLVKILVGGEVRTPSIYSVPPETTVAQAIVGAGGPTELAALEKVRVIRDGRELTVDIRQANATSSGLTIRSGDQILVPRRRNVLRDFIGPALSGVAAAAALTNIFLR